MTRDELVLLVKRFFDNPRMTDDEVNRLVLLAEDAAPNGDIGDLLFLPGGPSTPEGIVDEALRRSAEWHRDL